MARILSLIILLLLPRVSCACLNDHDSDTLAEEARGLPDVVQVITGRFERNPPLYYEMRIKRVAAELQAHPEQLSLYDDIAVACDRLGRDTEATTWIEKKRQQLEWLGITAKANHEQWYRYYANAGTFLAHGWLRAGADAKTIKQMGDASEDIRKAMHLKPNAHFGREKFQLWAMEWIVKNQKPPENAFPDTRFMSFLDDHSHATYTPHEAVTGLAGLVVLGNAWESLDVFNALRQALEKDERRSSLSYLAALRCKELIDEGKRSLASDASSGQTLKKLLFSAAPDKIPYDTQQVENAYHQLRREANAWQQQRTAYMMQRLQAGQHPDTDPTFWKDYADPGPPSLESFTPWYQRPHLVRNIISMSLPDLIGNALLMLVLASPFLWLLTFVCKKIKQRRIERAKGNVTVTI